jgi:hypothetical protein
MSSSLNIAEIKARARIADIWLGLGGAELKGRRGVAFWRSGTGLSVSVDLEKGVWFDHVAGAGGGAIELVQAVRGCSFSDALRWLADFCGISGGPVHHHHDHEADDDSRNDRRWSFWWGFACETLCELLLEELPFWAQERYPLTQLLARLRLGPESLLHEYHEWRERFPELTTALARVGRQADARRQKRLMAWVGRYLSEPPRA